MSPLFSCHPPFEYYLLYPRSIPIILKAMPTLTELHLLTRFSSYHHAQPPHPHHITALRPADIRQRRPPQDLYTPIEYQTLPQGFPHLKFFHPIRLQRLGRARFLAPQLIQLTPVNTGGYHFPASMLSLVTTSAACIHQPTQLSAITLSNLYLLTLMKPRKGNLNPPSWIEQEISAPL